VFFGVDWVEEEDQRQVRTTHSGSATGDLDHREHEEESSAARKARAAATAAMLPDAARLAMQVAAEEVERAVAEEERRAHWMAGLNTALARRQDERRREASAGRSNTGPSSRSAARKKPYGLHMRPWTGTTSATGRSRRLGPA
jgi:hypothetical protein